MGYLIGSRWPPRSGTAEKPITVKPRNGETGIVVSGHDNALLNSTFRYSAGAGIYLSGLRHTVHNCLIDEVDYSSHYLYSLHVEAEEDFVFGGHTLTYNTACVNIHERANVLRTEFTRSCAELQPEDFPEGKPFRFGHDFQNPPPLPKWPQLETMQMEAEKCTALSSGAAKTPNGVTRLKEGDWFEFTEVDLSQGWQSAVLRFASDVREMNAGTSGQEAPRHEKTTDPLVLDCSVLAERPGYDAASPGITNAWTFARNVQDGEKLGEFYPRFTGGPDVFRETVATLVREGRFVYPSPANRPLPPDVRRLPSRLRQKLETQKE